MQPVARTNFDVSMVNASRRVNDVTAVETATTTATKQIAVRFCDLSLILLIQNSAATVGILFQPNLHK